MSVSLKPQALVRSDASAKNVGLVPVRRESPSKLAEVRNDLFMAVAGPVGLGLVVGGAGGERAAEHIGKALRVPYGAGLLLLAAGIATGTVLGGAIGLVSTPVLAPIIGAVRLYKTLTDPW